MFMPDLEDGEPEAEAERGRHLHLPAPEPQRPPAANPVQVLSRQDRVRVKVSMGTKKNIKVKRTHH